MFRFIGTCKLAIATVAFASFLATPTTVSAETTTLKFAMPGHSYDSQYVNVLIPWAKKVEAESKGEIKIQFFVGPQIANFQNLIDRILGGVVDLGFGLLGPTGQPFPRTDVANLPFITGDPAEAAPALWTLYESGLISEEHKRWKVLGFFSFPGGELHLTKPLNGMEDLLGNKLAASSRLNAEVVKALGGTPVSMPPTSHYQAISNGVMQGVVMPWTGIADFKLYEVAKNHLVTNLGVTPAAIFMNKDVYEKLSPEARKVIDQNSGLGFSRDLGNAVSQHGRDMYKKIAAEPGQIIKQLTPDQKAKFAKALQPVIDSWVASTPNGAKILAEYTALVEKYKNNQ